MNGPELAHNETLAQLYENVFTGVVRIQAGRQQVQNVETFRSRVMETLNEVARLGALRGFQPEDIREANFAVVAFLDEAVLTSSDLSRAQWARKTLQEELFDQRSAGELFFERLERLRAHRDSPELAQLLEIYYLCLLLGYEGRYALGSKAELRLLMDNLRERIERISGRNDVLSPDALLPVDPPQAPMVDTLAAPMRRIALWAAGVTASLFVVFLLHLHWITNRIGSVIGVAHQP